MPDMTHEEARKYHVPSNYMLLGSGVAVLVPEDKGDLLNDPCITVTLAIDDRGVPAIRAGRLAIPLDANFIEHLIGTATEIYIYIISGEYPLKYFGTLSIERDSLLVFYGKCQAQNQPANITVQ